MEERAVCPASVCSLIPGLTAAIAANPAAAAEFAVATILSIPKRSSAGDSQLPGVLGALTTALAPAEDATKAAVCEGILALLAHHPRALPSGRSSTDEQGMQAQPFAEAAPQMKSVAVAAVLSRQAGMVDELQSACQAQGEMGAGLTDSAAAAAALRTAVAPEEQSALIHHLLLCTSAPGACSVLEVWAALQPLCGCFCRADTHAVEHLPCLPQWIVAQVLLSLSSASVQGSGSYCGLTKPQSVPATPGSIMCLCKGFQPCLSSACCGLLQVRASSAGTGLPVLPDSLAAVCCGSGGCSREPVLAALAELRGGPCDAAAAQLMQAVDGGLLSWLTSGAAAQEASIRGPLLTICLAEVALSDLQVTGVHGVLLGRR